MKTLYRLLARPAILTCLLLTAGAACAQTNLVVNGGFEQGSGSGFYAAYGLNTFNGFAPTGWLASSTYYGNLVVSQTAANPYSNDWGGVGVATDFQLTTPDGGNFVIADTDRTEAPAYSGEIAQQINGLAIGQSYTLTFYQASSGKYQAKGASVQTTQWDVTFGDSTQVSPLMTAAYNTSTPWEKVTMSFTATSTSQLLSFFGNGSPGGTPVIMAAIDGVSLTAAMPVPEPATWGMTLLGVAVIGAFVSTRRRQS
ncbi:MAG TPA: PEP-CTERM sorting domain-containing protein [Burkholderiaceae bacterium]|jgi:hypothetical protein